jgi:hypothetical protein
MSKKAGAAKSVAQHQQKEVATIIDSSIFRSHLPVAA